MYIYGKQTLYDGVIESSNRKVGTLHPPKTFARISMRLQRKKLHSNTINESGHKPHECCCSQSVRTLNPKS
jgi:hypothetical protein